MKNTIVVISLMVVIAIGGCSGSRQIEDVVYPPPNFKVAFIGDQGVNPNAVKVLELIKKEGADMVLHQGDLGYGNQNDPKSAVDWDNQINNILGPDFPYFVSVGNHDVDQWSVYRQKLQNRLDRIKDVTCTGDLGVKSACTYRGLFFILSGAGTMDFGHAAYLRDQLAEDN